MRSTSADPSKRTKVWKFRDQRFYAERGQIHIADEHTGDYRKVSISDFIQRMKAKQAESMKTPYRDERNEMILTVEGMLACARMAKSQGDPHSDKDRGYIARHRGKNRILVPGSPYNPQRPGGKLIIATR